MIKAKALPMLADLLPVEDRHHQKIRPEDPTLPATVYRLHEHTNPWKEANGRSGYGITCPFCGLRLKVYMWSICGTGKRCTCGAMHMAGHVSKIDVAARAIPTR